MIRGTKVFNNKNISITSMPLKYNKPDYVYIPLISYKNKNFDILVKPDDYVLKGQVIARSKDKFSFPIHSSVSGLVKEIQKRKYIDNEDIDSIVIENDFLEKEKKIGNKHKINSYSIEEVVEILKECGIVGMSGNNFPTYYKYGMELKIKKLIINAVESESFLTSDFTVLNSYTSEILETIDALMEIFKIEECVIAVKDFNKKAVDDLVQYIGSYTKISIKSVPDNYTMGWEKYLTEYLFKVKIKKYPMEKSILVENISTIFGIYEALKYRKPIVERIVTFSGDALKKPQNVLVKIGTPIKEVINFIGGYITDKKPYLIVNGPMMGHCLETDDTVITKNMCGVIALNKIDTSEEMDCINCGKCTNICPNRLAPILIINEKNVNNIKKLHPEKCIGCGLCSYICPAKIHLREKVLNIRDKVIQK